MVRFKVQVVRIQGMDSIKENWQVISFIVLIATVVWKARGWVSSVDSRLDTVDSGLDTVGSRLNTLEETVKGIKKNVEDIFDLLLKRGSPVTGGKSPTTLTSLGEEIAKEISAREWAQRLADILIAEVTGKHYYEMEEFCFQYMRGEPMLSEEMNQKVKKIAYERGITQRDVLDVLTLELRDELIVRVTQ